MPSTNDSNGCCPLRIKYINFAWLDLIYITGCILVYHYYTWFHISQMNSEIQSGIFYLFCTIMAIQLIKALTITFLKYGLKKKYHVAYVPWLFIKAVENILLLYIAFGLFIGGFIHKFFFIGFGIFNILIGNNCYLWFKIYSFYRDDKTAAAAIIVSI